MFLQKINHRDLNFARPREVNTAVTSGVDRARATIDSLWTFAAKLRSASACAQALLSRLPSGTLLGAASHPSFTATRLDSRVSIRRRRRLARSPAEGSRLLVAISLSTSTFTHPPRRHVCNRTLGSYAAHPRVVPKSFRNLPRAPIETAASRAKGDAEKFAFRVDPASSPVETLYFFIWEIFYLGINIRLLLVLGYFFLFPVLHRCYECRLFSCWYVNTLENIPCKSSFFV